MFGWIVYEEFEGVDHSYFILILYLLTKHHITSCFYHKLIVEPE